MRVVRSRDEAGRVRVRVPDADRQPVARVCRFLVHLADADYSPHAAAAYGYDLRLLFEFRAEQGLDWREFRPSTALAFLGFLRRRPSRRPAQHQGLAVVAPGGRLLAPATVAPALAATSSFYDWAISAEEFTDAENPLARRPDPALARASDRHRPATGRASRQAPIRRTVRVRLPQRSPRPLADGDVALLLADLTRLRDLALYLLMLDGGLRPGEALSLHLADAAYGRRRVVVRKRDDHPGGVRQKSRRERVVDCTTRGPWARSAATSCTSAPPTRAPRSCSWSAAAGSAPPSPWATRRWSAGSPAAATGSGSGPLTSPRTRCDTRTKRRCGRAGCTSWRCRPASATPAGVDRRLHPRVRRAGPGRVRRRAAGPPMTGLALVPVALPAPEVLGGAVLHGTRTGRTTGAWRRHHDSPAVRRYRPAPRRSSTPDTCRCCWCEPGRSASSTRGPTRHSAGCPAPLTYCKAQLEPGDRLVLLTDGMLERNASQARIPDLLSQISDLPPPREAVQALTNAV